MPKRSQSLELVIRAKDAASKEFKKLDKAIAGVGKRIKAMPRSVLNLKTAFVGLGIGLLAKNFINASNKQAQAVAGLETALKSMGRYTPELSKEMQALAASLQQVTNYGDEATIEGQKFLVTYREITDDLLPRSTKVMLDLAALMGGDTVRAANMLGKASMGMVGELRRVGITVDADTYKLKGYAGMLDAVETQVKGQAEAQRKATGSMIALGNSIGDIKEKAGDILKLGLEPLFSSLVKKIDGLNGAIQRLLLDNEFRGLISEMGEEFKEKLEEVSKKVLDVSKKIGVALFSLLDEINKHPEIVEYGLIGYFIWGKKGTVVGAAVGKMIGQTKDDLKDAREAVGLIEKSKALFRGGGKASVAGITSMLPGANLLLDQTEKASSKITMAIDQTASDAGSAAQRFLKKLKEEWGEGIPAPEIKDKGKGKPGKPTLKPPPPKIVIDLMSKAEKDLMSLEIIYQKGEEELLGYLQRRKGLVLQVLNEEIRSLERAANAETDTAKRLKLEDDIWKKKNEYALKEIELEKEIAEAVETAAERKTEAEKMFSDLRLRAQGDREAQYDIELAELDARQSEELDRFKQLLDDKLAAEMEYTDKAAALRGFEAEQAKEKDQIIADQDRRIWEQKLENAATISGGISDIFQNLYELSGEKNKEMFYAAKAAALAEAIVNVAQGVTKAIAQGGIMGVVTGAIVAAAGGIQIGTIMAQSLAAGGMVKGYSPSKTADNIPIAATANEFVQPVDTVRHYGAQAMEAIRQRIIPRELLTGAISRTLPVHRPSYAFAAGGMVSPSSAGQGEMKAETTIINVTDTRELDRYMASAAGQNAVVNVISSRAGKIRKILR